MDDNQGLNRRVGVLETKMAEIATLLGGVRGALEEVKTGMANAKPPMWMLLPALIGIIGIIGTVMGFGLSIQTELASIRTVTVRSDAESAIIRERISTLEQRSYQEVKDERDYLRSRSWQGNGNVGPPKD